MDVEALAKVKAGEVLDAARRARDDELNRRASRGTFYSGDATMGSLRLTLEALREGSQATLRDLDGRRMTRPEIGVWERAWRDALTHIHRDLLEEHRSRAHEAYGVLRDEVDSEVQLGLDRRLQELETFIAKQEDREREARGQRRLSSALFSMEPF